MIFVGCAPRSPTAYERGINYPGASVRSLSASLPFHHTSSFPLSPSQPELRPSHSACSRQSLPVVVRSSLSVSLTPTAGAMSIMTPPWWDDTGSEVRTAEPRRSLNGKFELRRRGPLQGATHARSLARVKEKSLCRCARHSREHESRASSCRGKVASRRRGGFVESAAVSKRADWILGSESSGTLIFGWTSGAEGAEGRGGPRKSYPEI